jgi:hypothetical protein
MRRPASLVFLPLVFAAACAGNEGTTPTGEGGTASPPAAEVTTPAEPECADLTGEARAPIRMDDVYFDPRCAIVSGDQKLEFVNEGKSRHSFTITRCRHRCPFRGDEDDRAADRQSAQVW